MLRGPGGGVDGMRVILTEENDWLGGQLTSQACRPMSTSGSRSLAAPAAISPFATACVITTANYPLSDAAKKDPNLNPGGGYVSRLCPEPRVCLAVIEQMMAVAAQKGSLRCSPIASRSPRKSRRSRRLRYVQRSRAQRRRHDLRRKSLDATEIGELLPLAKVEYVVGAESKKDTNEPHAARWPAGTRQRAASDLVLRDGIRSDAASTSSTSRSSTSAGAITFRSLPRPGRASC